MLSGVDLAELESLVLRVAARSFAPALRAPSELARAAEQVSERYTIGREALAGRRAFTPAELAARLLFFAVVDAPKLALIVDELLAIAGLPGAAGPERPSLLDLGCGVGASSLGITLGLAAAGGPPPGRITLVDSDGAALAIARAVVDELGVEGVARQADLRRFVPEGRHDLVVLGHVLNELDPASRSALVVRALSACAPGGRVIVVEPATREAARDLHALRDDLLAQGRARVLAPCFRQGPCPMRTRERDWCHEDRPLPELPPLARELSRATRLRRERLKFAYLVLEPASGPCAGDEAAGWLRATSDVQGSKGKHEVELCGHLGLLRVALLRRHRAEHNRAFEAIRRGDRVRLALEEAELDGPPGAPARGRATLAPDAVVTVDRGSRVA